MATSINRPIMKDLEQLYQGENANGCGELGYSEHQGAYCSKVFDGDNVTEEETKASETAESRSQSDRHSSKNSLRHCSKDTLSDYGNSGWGRIVTGELEEIGGSWGRIVSDVSPEFNGQSLVTPDFHMLQPEFHRLDTPDHTNGFADPGQFNALCGSLDGGLSAAHALAHRGMQSSGDLAEQRSSRQEAMLHYQREQQLQSQLSPTHQQATNVQQGGYGARVPGTAPMPMGDANAPNCQRHSSEPPPPEWANAYTVMMRNLPNKYTQTMLREELAAHDFEGTFDFLYLPVDQETGANKGYAFVNFVDPHFSWTFRQVFEGRKMSRFNSNKHVTVMPAALQGLEANYAHYANARVSRGDLSTRPIFLREPQVAQEGPRRRRKRGGGGSAIDLAWRKRAEAERRAQAGERPETQVSTPVRLANASAAQNRPSNPQVPHTHVPVGRGVSPAMSPGPQDSGVYDIGAGVNTRTSKRGPGVNFCPYCGGKVEQIYPFCQYCGANLQ